MRVVKDILEAVKEEVMKLPVMLVPPQAAAVIGILVLSLTWGS